MPPNVSQYLYSPTQGFLPPSDHGPVFPPRGFAGPSMLGPKLSDKTCHNSRWVIHSYLALPAGCASPLRFPATSPAGGLRFPPDGLGDITPAGGPIPAPLPPPGRPP